jgi:hypothetical protein
VVLLATVSWPGMKRWFRHRMRRHRRRKRHHALPTDGSPLR